MPKVVAAAPRSVLMVVTDPPDPLADLTRRLAGHDRVFSTGTLIDSLRFRVHLADRLRVRPRDVQAMVVGEHGTSEVLLWSSASVGGVPVLELLGQSGQPLDQLMREIEDDIRACEHRQCFDEEFIRLARAVYFENDERARIKKQINLALGSAYVEEKSYKDYRQQQG